NSLKEQAERLGVADRIVWFGHATQDELVGSYLAAKALWFPSTHKSEAYGLVQVEALASGCPVINTEVPDSGVTWVSRHNETGFTVPVNSPSRLAEAAMRLVRYPGLRDRFSAAAKQRAEEDFCHQSMGVRSLNAYQHVVDVHRECGAGLRAEKRLHRRFRDLPEELRDVHVELAF